MSKPIDVGTVVRQVLSMYAKRGALVIVVALTVAAASAAAPAVSDAASTRQDVAVAFLEPETEVDVDVTTGAVAVGGYGQPFDEPPEEQQGLAGFVDPYTRSLFVYRTGGIPGVTEPDRDLGAAQVPPAGLPGWGAPQLQPIGPRQQRVLLADGRYATIETDERNRATAVRWPTAQGPWVTTAISYASGRTTVRMPFGVRRTYVYNPAGLITKMVAPGAARHARHDTVGGLLDTSRTEHLRAKRLQVFSRAEKAINGAAPRELGNLYVDEPANGGYEVFGVSSFAAARRLNRRIEQLGLLDVAEAIPERHTWAQEMRETDRLTPLFKRLGECVISTGVRFGAGVEVGIARTITATEVGRLDKLLITIPDWVYVYWGSSTECSTPD